MFVSNVIIVKKCVNKRHCTFKVRHIHAVKGPSTGCKSVGSRPLAAMIVQCIINKYYRDLVYIVLNVTQFYEYQHYRLHISLVLLKDGKMQDSLDYTIITSTNVLDICHSQMTGDSDVHKQYLIMLQLHDHAELLSIFH